MILFRILFFPVKLLAAVAAVALRLGLWAGALPFRVTGRAARLVGLKGTVLFGAGAAAGLLLAPAPGRDLRQKVQASLGGGGGAVGDDDLAEKVRFELAHAPRTWHLPQPTVTVAAGRVVLSGEVPHAEGSDELTRVASGVPGVTAVENRLDVTDVVDELIAEELAEEIVEELVAEAIAEEIAEEIVEELVAEAIAEEIAEEMVTEELAEELTEELVADGMPEDVAEELAEEIAEELVAEGAADEMIEGLAEVLLEVADAEAAAEGDDED